MPQGHVCEQSSERTARFDRGLRSLDLGRAEDEDKKTAFFGLRADVGRMLESGDSKVTML